MRTITVLLVLLLNGILTTLLGQSHLPPGATTAALRQLATEQAVKSRHARQQASQLARQKGWPVRITRPDGQVMELQTLGRNQQPVYYMTHNLNAARSVFTNELWPGGLLNTDLTGRGMQVGEWDAGLVRSTHRELRNRVMLGDTATIFDDHATHVAGTLIAAGTNVHAHGMAPEAQLEAYDWNDDLAEMADAATKGLLLSNHSYGPLQGWHWNFLGDDKWAWFGDVKVSDVEDYRFGFYDLDAQTWDLVSHLAPDYLIVKAAGNDRADLGPEDPTEFHWIYDSDLEDWVKDTTPRFVDGPDNSVAGSAVAKNVLTVGAVDDLLLGYQKPADVVMTDFSCWGPTDDGRIKPDIVGNGVELESSIANSDVHYEQMSGTSMAAPNVCGSLVLLQQLHKRLHVLPMLAATLKALVIHTANEAGPAIGPDYRFGWGLFNAAQAAKVILEDRHLMLEDTLKDGATFSLTVQALGNQPLIATICWTDIPGLPPAPAVNPTDKMLVNDLDLRIRDTKTTYFPFVLDPDNPKAPATAGDNERDNVEKIIIPKPEAGDYEIVVSHKGVLEEKEQAFSLIVSGIKTQAVPVELSYFSYNAAAAGVELIWQTASESNNYGFQIHRKAVHPDSNWALIGFVKGHQTSAEVHRYQFGDRNLQSGWAYQYRLKQLDIDGTFTYSHVINVAFELPTAFQLAQNYPNPVGGVNPSNTHANHTTLIQYLLPQSGQVKLEIYNLMGQKVMTLIDQSQPAGQHAVAFDASALNSGIYFYTLASQNQTLTRKLVVTR